MEAKVSLSKFLAILLLLGVAVGLGVAIMIYGWGLHPRSWWWIIGGGVFGQAFVKVVWEKVDKS
jgi:hypothetical protein